MDLLDRLRHVAHRLDPERFERAHVGLYLFGSRPSTVDQPGAASLAYATQPSMRLSSLTARILQGDVKALLESLCLYRIEKSDRNPWKGRISVGRAPNNDVVVRHASISKLHAHLVPTDADPEAIHPLAVTLMDVGSRNGTWINGVQVAADAPRAIQAGDRLTFGAISLELLDAVRLHQRLRAIFPPEPITGDQPRPVLSR
jgi:hypothetical protein